MILVNNVEFDHNTFVHFIIIAILANLEEESAAHKSMVASARTKESLDLSIKINGHEIDAIHFLNRIEQKCKWATKDRAVGILEEQVSDVYELLEKMKKEAIEKIKEED